MQILDLHAVRRFTKLPIVKILLSFGGSSKKNYQKTSVGSKLMINLVLGRRPRNAVLHTSRHECNSSGFTRITGHDKRFFGDFQKHLINLSIEEHFDIIRDNKVPLLGEFVVPDIDLGVTKFFPLNRAL